MGQSDCDVWKWKNNYSDKDVEILPGGQLLFSESIGRMFLKKMVY